MYINIIFISITSFVVLRFRSYKKTIRNVSMEINVYLFDVKAASGNVENYLKKLFMNFRFKGE